MTKTKELRELTLDELEHEADRNQARAVQPAVPAGHRQAGQLGSPGQVRREVARISTLLREREIEAAEAAGGEELMADEPTPETADTEETTAEAAARRDGGSVTATGRGQRPHPAAAPLGRRGAAARGSTRPRSRRPAGSQGAGPAASPAPARTAAPNRRKVREGLVLSVKMDKTAVSVSSTGCAIPATPRPCSGPSASTPMTRPTICGRRPGPRGRDPAPVQAQALAGRRSPRAGQ